MKKTLLATAVALAAASSAQAATVYNEDGTTLDVYGNVQIGYRNIKDDAGDSRDDLFDNGTTFGFAAQHQITNDVIGYMKLEIDDIDATEMKTGPRQDGGDQAYIGVKGNFGDFRIGSFDTVMDDWIQDPLTNNEYFDATDSNGFANGNKSGSAETDQIRYMSPVMGGVQLALGMNYKGDAESENSTNSSEQTFYGGVKYAVGAFSVAAVYDTLGIQDDETDIVTGDDLGDRYGVNAQYTINALRLSAKYEVFDAEASNSDVTYAGIGARYGYGMGDVYGAYQNVDDDSVDDKRNEFIVGGTYNISDAMYTWAEIAKRDRDEDAGDGFGVGVTYMF
ncbi:porin [Terasakiispira papahanaumokuakeensis]|uniref:Porin n=1 Tax=Terasakiispira papahanaumokuakeensis TaxID=197479 RepID=A0A1E2V604_9GAMM|nr:porin [Terasakiispira papahanaumokuakeensis]ODC02440.1 porin [Terasakiispira papahanaumokuakeensis]